MKTWVWCFKRRKAVAWTMRSRSRWNSERVGLPSSGKSRPRDAHGSAAYAARSPVPKPSACLSNVMRLSWPLLLHCPLTCHLSLHTYSAIRHIADTGNLYRALNSAGANMTTANVILSDAAARRIAEIVGVEADKQALRVSVEGGGCSGFSYKFDLDGAPTEDDTVLANGDATVLIDSLSLVYMEGSAIGRAYCRER